MSINEALRKESPNNRGDYRKSRYSYATLGNTPVNAMRSPQNVQFETTKQRTFSNDRGPP